MRLCIIALLLLALPIDVVGREDRRTVDLEALRDAARCDGEVMRVLKGSSKEEYEYVLNGFRHLKAPQRDGKALHVLLVDYDLKFDRSSYFDGYEIEDPDELFRPEPKPEPKSGVRPLDQPTLERLSDYLVVVTPESGKEIRPFGGDNVIDGGYVYDFNRDGVLERADATNYGLSDPKVHPQVFQLRTVERKSRVLFRVVINWEAQGNWDEHDDWGFECFDAEGDGFVEIAFGPEQADGSIKREVTFSWNAKKGTYESPDQHPHLRVLESGKVWDQLNAMAKEGGMKYPDAAKPVEDEVAPEGAEPVENAEPYIFASLRDAGDPELMTFMKGKRRADSWRPNDEVRTHLPDGFWKMAAKTAAMQLVETNRRPDHRAQFRLAVDDRNGVAPPKSGWLLHDFRGDNSYTYYAHVFAIRFGVKEPFLLFAAESSQGMVGANSLVDRAGYTIRIISLSPAEARFLADTVFWLDRLRSQRKAGDDDHSGRGGSSADGWAILHMIEDGKPPRKIAGDTAWAMEAISTRFGGQYDPETCLNIVEFLLGEALPKQLGARWDAFPDIDVRVAVTRLEDRLKPRHDKLTREVLSDLAREVLQMHKTDRVPPTALRRIVDCAGDAGLVELREALQELEAGLPAEDDEDREYEQLRQRFRRDHFGNWERDDGHDEKHKKDYARYEELIEKRKLEPGPILRKSLAYVRRQLDAYKRPDKLMAWALSHEGGNTWALQQLEQRFPDAHADVLMHHFEDAEGEGRIRIFQTIAAANPKAALQLRDTLSEEEVKAMVLELAAFEAREDPARLASRVPALFAVANNKKNGRFWRRGTAMELLEKVELNEEEEAQLEELVMAELDPANRDKRRLNLGSAVKILLARPDRDRYWDQLAEAGPKADHYTSFGTLINALAILADDGPPGRRKALEATVRNRLENNADGMVNDALRAALALDLRGLKDDLQMRATSGPEVPNGDGAEYSGGSFKGTAGERYHLARIIVALWSEPDAKVRARMWLAFALSDSYHFNPRFEPMVSVKLREQVENGIAVLAPAERETAIEALVKAIKFDEPEASVVEWLKGAASGR